MSAQVIGYLGENGVRDVRIPIGHLLDKWQGLSPLLVMVPVGCSDDEAYPVQYTLDGTDIVWHVSDADTAVAGTTKAAVRMVDDGGRVGMDEPFQVIISPNLSAGGDPPLVIKPWVDKLATLVPRAEAAAERAENATERAENAAERVETGTAPNALALGGKPPECYLPAAQLIGNPDFAIAQEGHGGLHGTERYAADRWFSWNCSIAVNGDVKTLTATEWAFVQQVLWKDGRDLGKSFTLAITLDDDTVRLCSGTVTSSTSGETLVAETEVRPGVWVSLLRSSAGDFVARITLNHAGAMVSFKHLRMFQGTYTAKTLPPFVPPDPTLELMKCKYRYQKYQFATWAAIGSGFSSNVATAYLFFTPEVPLADDVNISLTMTGNILYRVNGKTYNIDASTGTVINHTNMLLIQFTGLSIDSSDLNSAGFFINGGTSAITVEISADP